jgi:hypothetical protein
MPSHELRPSPGGAGAGLQPPLGEHPFHVAGAEVRRRRAPGRLHCRWWCRAPSRRDRPAAGPGRRRAADRVTVQRAPRRTSTKPCTTPALPLDPARDAWTLPLIPRCWRAACRCWPSAAARRNQRGAGRHAAPGGAGRGPLQRPPRRQRPARRGAVRPTRTRCTWPGGLLAAHPQGAQLPGELGARPGPSTAGPGPARGGHRARRPGRGLLGRRRARLQPVRCSGTPNGRRPTTRCRCSCFTAFGEALRNYRDRVRGPLPA